MVPTPVRLLQDSLTASARVRPEKVAVVSNDARVTYGELHRRAHSLAGYLRVKGVARGDRVAIFLENSHHAVVALYGTLYADAAFVVINPQTKADKLAYMLADAGVTAVISEGRLAAIVDHVAVEVPSLSVKIRVDGGAPDWIQMSDILNQEPGRFSESRSVPLDLAALVYTSGSTGNPKGVMLSHQNMVFAQASVAEYLRLDHRDKLLNVLPLAFDYGLYQVLMTVHVGATIVLEKSFAFPAAVVRRVVEEEVTVFPGVPTMFASLLALNRGSPSQMPSVKCITNTAAHLPDEYVSGLASMFPNAHIFKMYGLTECKRVCYLEPELIAERPSSVGKAIPGTETYLLDEDGREVPAGQTGVLFVRGPHVMMGYWNLPAETDHMLKPGRYPGERVLCTHDYFRQDEDGFLYFVGRSDEIIKSRGEKVSPVEVENALAAIPGVLESAVVGVADELLGQAVQAFVVLSDGVRMTESVLKREAMKRLENFMVPRDVFFVAELPKTATGKVRKKSLVGETVSELS